MRKDNIIDYFKWKMRSRKKSGKLNLNHISVIHNCHIVLIWRYTLFSSDPSIRFTNTAVGIGLPGSDQGAAGADGGEQISELSEVKYIK